MSDQPGAFLLPLILALPLLGALFVMCTPKTRRAPPRPRPDVHALITFLVSLLILGYFDTEPGFQLEVDMVWIPRAGHPLQPRHRRHLAVAGAADHAS